MLAKILDFGSRMRILRGSALAIVMLGCGPAWALSPQPQPLPQRTEIKVGVQERAGYMSPLLHVGPILAAMNIDYKEVQFQRYPDSRAAILTQAIDVGCTGAAHVIQDLANGGNRLIALRGVAAMEMYPIVRNGLKIEKWEDLKGKRVGVGVGGNMWTMFVSKLNEVGIKYTEIEAIGIQGSGRNFNLALQRGDIDVSIGWSPFNEMAVVEGVGQAAKALEYGNSQALGSEQGMWVTTRDTLDTKRELVKRFLWAYAKAEEITNSSTEKKIDTLLQYTQQSPAVAVKTSEWMSLTSAISPDQMVKMAKLLFDLGVVKSDVSATVAKHYDAALANEVAGK